MEMENDCYKFIWGFSEFDDEPNLQSINDIEVVYFRDSLRFKHNIPSFRGVTRGKDVGIDKYHLYIETGIYFKNFKQEKKHLQNLLNKFTEFIGSERIGIKVPEFNPKLDCYYNSELECYIAFKDFVENYSEENRCFPSRC